MKIKDKVYCKDIGIYSGQLTKRKNYIVEEKNAENIRIWNDEGKLRWYSDFYFSLNNEPEITSIHIDDEIENIESDAIEVSIEFSDKTKYGMTFTTPQYLDKILDKESYFSSKHFMIIKYLTEESIKSTVLKLDEQNELIENCKKYE
ncbi:MULTISPECIES: hypothetical protein [unclassified Chryseobacterium]|uniref:hypothetical protein n=1 Tax=unclassified Chryseobacterium TaxID=2593645 RepID=UPI000E70CC37|nr:MULTISPECIES: hypothetical protein [unclassified Chryseobacterium]RKE78893.1 hypothetical protein DEU39_3143 [Chryseobacterium sp. AG363]WNI35668.1 hypothetical protein RHP76_17005 [Chryseobacterium sp. SG20098]